MKKVKLRKLNNGDQNFEENASEKTFKVEEVDEEENTHSPMNTNGKKAAAANKANEEAREIWKDLPEEINTNE